jgi:hypothetical protein
MGDVQVYQMQGQVQPSFDGHDFCSRIVPALLQRTARYEDASARSISCKGPVDIQLDLSLARWRPFPP